MLHALVPAASANAMWLYAVQFVFLFTGVFSTCVAQYVFYQGAGDQRAMLLPLCNFLGIMLVGLIPVSKSSRASTAKAKSESMDLPKHVEVLDVTHTTTVDNDDDDEPECTGGTVQSSGANAWESEENTLTRRPGGAESTGYDTDTDTDSSSTFAASPSSSVEINASQSSVYFSFSTVQLCIGLSVILDFAGCIFSNIGLAMAGSGLYQVLYSSVICWSALLSRFILKKVVSKEEWTGIALVTFGLAFSALGQSGAGRNQSVVLMGCFNSLLGAAFYGGNYVTGEYMLKLPERPQPQELCLKIGSACMVILGVYQAFYVLPFWHELVTKPIQEANGNTTNILAALIGYTFSQLAHGLTYFMMLGSSGAVTTGIMQSLRAVCVFILSSVLFCSHQESQCFDMKRGVATLIVVCGVMFYSWAKSQANAAPAGGKGALPGRRAASKLIAGKNFVV